MAGRQISSKGKKQVETHDFGWFKPGGAAVFSRELLESDAWADLKHHEHGVLMDLLWTASCARGEPFFFTWSQCHTQISESAFRTTLDRFCRMGFLKKLKSPKEAGPMLYTSSGEWRNHKPSDCLMGFKRYKKDRITNSRSNLRKSKSNHAPTGCATTPGLVTTQSVTTPGMCTSAEKAKV